MYMHRLTYDDFIGSAIEFATVWLCDWLVDFCRAFKEEFEDGEIYTGIQLREEIIATCYQIDMREDRFLTVVRFMNEVRM